MKIANQETIKSIVQPEDKPTVESGKVRENTSLGIANLKSGFDNLIGPNDIETMITQNQAETLSKNQAETLTKNQAETLKQKPAVDQVLHWLLGPNNVETMVTQNQAETLKQNQAETLKQNQAETLQPPKPASGQVPLLQRLKW